MSSSSPDVWRAAARQQALHPLNTPPMPPVPPRRRWRKMAALGLGILLLLLAGILTGSVFFSRSVTPAPVAPAAASSPVAASSSAVTAAGFIKADRLSTVSAEITGTVEEIYVQPGDTVKKGDRQASLDGRSLRVQIAALKASRQMVAGKLAQVMSRLPRA